MLGSRLPEGAVISCVAQEDVHFVLGKTLLFLKANVLAQIQNIFSRMEARPRAPAALTNLRAVRAAIPAAISAACSLVRHRASGMRDGDAFRA